ncbi:MAG: hypothetical protein J7K54_05060 [Candidatus Aenigmarchaeota archaeon]|nr:hypothetical protein [Candidatus Aenigmarchaeota archaeon]
MKRLLISIMVCILLSGALSVSALAAQLTVEKDVKSRDIAVGDNIEILLKFSNPFGKPLDIQIKDKNIIAGNGLDIQCFEYTLPADASSIIAYSQPITAFQPGDFTLGKATITYTNPDTGAQEQVQSNELELSVKNSQSQQNLQQQGITTVYQCGGMSMTSTSYSSSGSSTSIQISSGFGSSPSQQKSQSPGNIQQQNQDMSAIKKQMEEQMRQQEQMKEEMQKRIEQNSEFQRMQQQLQQHGYKPESADLNPSSYDTGRFEYTYKKENGDKAMIKGSMENGTVNQLQKWSKEDAYRLAGLLENSTEFKKLNESISRGGFNLSSKHFSFPESNVSNFRYTYKDRQGNQKSITGNMTVRGKLLEIEEHGDSTADVWGILLWIILAAAVLTAAVLIYRRYFLKKSVPAEEIKQTATRAVDIKKEAMALIKAAEKMFSEGKKKEAYAKVSEGVRLCYKHMLNSGKEELTSTDILKALKRHGNRRHFRDAEKCFELCDLVKFAKYAPNEKDFRKAVEKGKKIINRESR